MDQLVQVIKQLSDEEYLNFYRLLKEQKAEKSADYLKIIREGEDNDDDITVQLEVNKNSLYTLKSRLLKKIESFLVTQLKDYQMDLLRKAVNNPDLLYENSRDIRVITLKKLERDLLHYDLPYELITIYKALKKMYINTPEYYNYSQLYNKHIAYTLAIDKAEDLLGEFFKTYGNYQLTRNHLDKEQLQLFKNELENLCNLYESHRLFVYKCIVSIFYNIYLEDRTNNESEFEDTENHLSEVKAVFSKYPADPVYLHIKPIFDYLTFSYYHHLKLNKKAGECFDLVNDNIVRFLTYFNLNFYTSQFLITKIERYVRLGHEERLYEENKGIVDDLSFDPNNVSGYVNFVKYLALSCYYAGNIEEAARQIQKLRNRLSLKKYVFADIELKVLLCLFYCLLNEDDLCQQLIGSTKRQLRVYDKDKVKHIRLVLKIVIVSISGKEFGKAEKIEKYIKDFNLLNINEYSFLHYLKLDKQFIQQLTPLVKS